VLGPAVGLSSVVAGVIVSARVNDPRVAQQIGGIIIVPIIAVTLLQATGTLLVGAIGYLVLAAIIFVVSLIGLRVGVKLFNRETILTRWR
jgi:ABC-2 type transport system permease protein